MVGREVKHFDRQSPPFSPFFHHFPPIFAPIFAILAARF
jgi:hypothetical protein